MAETKEQKSDTKSKNELTTSRSMADFRAAYRAKRKLIERQREDFLFALGEQWSKDDVEKLKAANIKPITDNRIAPNIFLLTGLERQNRTDFKAFPTGEEDSIKAEIASALFKDAIKMSEFAFISSDQFKDGITCGESHLEMYLDFTDNLLNGTPMWRKLDGNALFPEPGFKKYDFSDCRYVYKVVLDVDIEDLVNLFPEKEDVIRKAGTGRLDLDAILGAGEEHTQRRDYRKPGEGSDSDELNVQSGFDLIERYYKKHVATYYVGDMKTGKLEQAESKETAEQFVREFKAKVASDQQAYDSAVQNLLMQHVSTLAANGDPNAALPAQEHLAMLNETGQLPPPPPQEDPERFIIIKRMVPEIWCFAHVPGIDEPLANERAWFYPKWKSYPFVPYFARFSTAPIEGDERHLLVQGIVHGVKGVQEKHNKAEMLMLRHLNQSSNSGWLVEEDGWVDEAKVQQAGSAPGVNLYYKKNIREKPERLFPMNLSTGHAELSAESAEAIKAQLGINADLLATQQGGSDSGRAIALRQRQGLLMVQELFDNLSRSRMIAGKFLLSQLGEIYDTETAKKILGDAFLKKNFPPPMELVAGPDGLPAIDPATGQPQSRPMMDPATQKPMEYDGEMAETAIAEVLSGELGRYDVAVGESVASETQKMANSAEVKEIAQTYPGLIPMDILVEESQLPQATKTRILTAVQRAQALQQEMANKGKPKPNGDSADKETA